MYNSLSLQDAYTLKDQSSEYSFSSFMNDGRYLAEVLESLEFDDYDDLTKIMMSSGHFDSVYRKTLCNHKRMLQDDLDDFLDYLSDNDEHVAMMWVDTEGDGNALVFSLNK